MESETKEQPEQKEDLNAVEVAERLEAANKEALGILEKQAEMRSKELIAGKSSTGEQPEKPKELTDHEYRLQVEKEIREGKYN